MAGRRSALIAQQRPDVVLLDLNMPVMNGWECHRRLREWQPELPVVFMSAAEAVHHEAQAHQADSALAKPFEVADLLTTVKQLAPRSSL